MKNNAGVDVAKAQAAGGGGDEDHGAAGDDASASAKDLLMRLPGVNVHNYRNVRTLYVTFFFFFSPVSGIFVVCRTDPLPPLRLASRPNRGQHPVVNLRFVLFGA